MMQGVMQKMFIDLNIRKIVLKAGHVLINLGHLENLSYYPICYVLKFTYYSPLVCVSIEHIINVNKMKLCVNHKQIICQYENIRIIICCNQ